VRVLGVVDDRGQRAVDIKQNRGALGVGAQGSERLGKEL
jgi:hypothetical protein